MSRHIPENATVYSPKTDTRYPSWDALVEAEANGYVAVAILEENAPKKMLFTASVGPFPTKREAENARARLRTSYKRAEREGNSPSRLVSITVKPLWKETF